MSANHRRDFLKFVAASGVLAGCAGMPQAGKKPVGRVVVVGGGYGGASAARALCEQNPDLQIVMIDRNPEFISCPLSNMVLAGTRNLEDISVSYSGLRRRGVEVVRDEVLSIDPKRQELQLARLERLNYDRLVISPGVDFMYEQIPALSDEAARERVPHAWRAGPQTEVLRRQLVDMRDGGVFVISIPMAPLKCPPAPYERACQVASYFKRAKPRSKIIILDANEDVASEKPIFTKAWNEQYQGMIEYRNNSELRDVDLKTLSARLDFDTVRADVLNVLPPMKAAHVAQTAGLITANGRWCGVDWLTMESVAAPGVHVLGDAILPAALMAKSGQIANQHGKVAAAAIGALLHGREPARDAQMRSICYSFVDDTAAAHVASLHRYDAAEKTFKVVPGSTNVSAVASESEGRDALAWAKNIWAEMLG